MGKLSKGRLGRHGGGTTVMEEKGLPPQISALLDDLKIRFEGVNDESERDIMDDGFSIHGHRDVADVAALGDDFIVQGRGLAGSKRDVDAVLAIASSSASLAVDTANSVSP